MKRLTTFIALVALLAGSAQAGPGRGGRSGAAGGGRAAGGGGTVLSVDTTAQTFIVQAHGAAVTVTTTSATTFQMSDGSAATFADIAVGAQVAVQGTTTGTSAVTATQVLILGGAGSGTVVSVDSAALTFVVQPRDATLGNITVTTTDSTVFQRSDGTAATIADVVVGSKVLVQSTVTGTNAVTATRVLILAANGTCAPSAGSGTVASVDATALSFVVDSRGTQVTVTTSTATVFAKSGGSAATFSDVIVGAKVAVQGAVTGTNTVDATRVVIVASSGTGSTGSSGGRRRTRR